MNDKQFGYSEASGSSHPQVHCISQNASMSGTGVCEIAENKSFRAMFLVGSVFLTAYALPPIPQVSDTSGVTQRIAFSNTQDIDDSDQASDINNRLDNIKTTLDLPVSTIIHFLNISRQTYYDWLNGGNPRDKKLQKVLFLDEIANHWNSLNSPIPFKTVLYARHSKGKFLFDVLSDDSIKVDEIKNFISKYVSDYMSSKERFDKA